MPRRKKNNLANLGEHTRKKPRMVTSSAGGQCAAGPGSDFSRSDTMRAKDATVVQPAVAAAAAEMPGIPGAPSGAAIVAAKTVAAEAAEAVEPAGSAKAAGDDEATAVAAAVAVPFKHATDRRVEGQVFVRLSKEEKRRLKYERAKTIRAAQHKKLKARKREIRAAAAAGKTDAELAAEAEAGKAEARASREHLARAMAHGQRVAIDLAWSAATAATAIEPRDVDGDMGDEGSSRGGGGDGGGVEGGATGSATGSATGWRTGTAGALATAAAAAAAAVNSERETNSLAKQCTYLYSALRKREGLISLHLVSYGGLAAARLEGSGAASWAVHRHPAPLEDVFEPSELVYLTPDAADELGALDQGSVYVVGGIVDRTPAKGLTAAKAQRLQVRSARLPLSLVPGFKSGGFILNVDTVVRALAAYQDCGGDWAAALGKVLPARHAAQGKHTERGVNARRKKPQ